MYRSALFAVVTLCWLIPQQGSAEVIGPFAVIDAPVQAELLGGGGASFSWLNVVNAPRSIQQAFTGFSIIDDGYANANSGTHVRLTFAPGVLRNDPGPDLVLFDAGGGPLNQYLIRTGFDNFNRAILAFPNTDTGEDRNYFYGGTGPFSYEIKAVALDLSQWGAPAGAIVSQVLAFTEGPACDLLGVGVLLSTCPSDIDGNGQVDFDDLDELIDSFGAEQESASWNPHADLNADGSVDLSDFARFQVDFEASCT